MNESTIGSTFEISLRILLMLNCLFPLQLDEQQIGMIDLLQSMPLILDYWMKICMDIAIIVLVNFRQENNQYKPP